MLSVKLLFFIIINPYHLFLLYLFFSEVQLKDVHGDKPSSIIEIPSLDSTISTNKPPVLIRKSHLWSEMMPHFNPFMNPMNVMDSAMFMGQVSINNTYDLTYINQIYSL